MKYTSEIFENKGQKSSFWPSALTIEIHCQGKKKFASIHNVPRHSSMDLKVTGYSVALHVYPECVHVLLEDSRILITELYCYCVFCV